MLLEFRGIASNTIVLDVDEVVSIEGLDSWNDAPAFGNWSRIALFNKEKFDVKGTPEELKERIEYHYEKKIAIDAREVEFIGANWYDAPKISLLTMGSFSTWQPKPKTHEELMQKAIDEAVRLAELKAPYRWSGGGDGYSDVTLLMKCMGEISKELVDSSFYGYIADNLWNLNNAYFKRVDLNDILPGDIIIYEAPIEAMLFSAIYIGDSNVVECGGWDSKVVNIRGIFDYKIKGALRLKTERLLEKTSECSYKTRRFAY